MAGKDRGIEKSLKSGSEKTKAHSETTAKPCKDTSVGSK